MSRLPSPGGREHYRPGVVVVEVWGMGDIHFTFSHYVTSAWVYSKKDRK